MKILLVTPFDLSCPGGVNEHIHHLDHQLQQLGHSTGILAPRSFWSGDEDDGHTFRVGRAISIPANGSKARVTLSPFISGKIKRFLEREKFDVIHLHDPLIPTLPLTVLRFSEAVNVATFHGSRSSQWGYNIGYKLGKPVLTRFVNKLHRRIAVSRTARNFIHSYYPGDYSVIPNGIDYDAFSPEVPPHPSIASDEPTVLFVGRYDEPRKGLRYLIEAFVQVQQSIPTCRLIVVGPGEPVRYQRMIQYHGLRNVSFTGPVPKSELPRYYAACDVFCAPSTRGESFGIVLLEGMAAGKPVVATDIDGYRAVVRNNQEGLLVEPKEPASLAAALTRVLEDQKLASRLGIAGRERARDFSWPIVAQRIVECYAEAGKWDGRADLSATTTSPLVGSTRRP